MLKKSEAATQPFPSMELPLLARRVGRRTAPFGWHIALMANVPTAKRGAILP